MMRRQMGWVVALAIAGCAAGEGGAGVPVTARLVAETDPPKAALRFLDRYVTQREGAIVPGADLTIEYALERLPTCRLSRAGYQLWDIEAHVKVQPSGVLLTSSMTTVADGTRIPHPLTVRVPMDAQRIEIWFRNYNGDQRCEEFDSDYGRNHHATIVAPPPPVAWAGDWGNGNWRGCEHRDGLDEPIVIDSYLRQRACLFVDADVWVPGLTDCAALRPQDLWAQVEWSEAGAPTRTEPLSFVARVGNNYRYRFQLPPEVRQPPFAGATFAFRFSSDGNDWYAIGPRTITTAAR